VFIDEVEVKEAVDVSDGRVVAYRVSLVGVVQAAKNVPRRGDCEEEQRPGEELELSPAAPLAHQQKVRHRGANKKCWRDQPFGQRGQRYTDKAPVKPDRLAQFEPSDQ